MALHIIGWLFYRWIASEQHQSIHFEFRMQFKKDCFGLLHYNCNTFAKITISCASFNLIWVSNWTIYQL